MRQPPPTLDQLLALTDEAERLLGRSAGLVQGGALAEARDACAIARGHLDLVRLHGEPMRIDILERALARIAGAFRDQRLQQRFLAKLGAIIAWSRFGGESPDPAQ